MEEKPKVEPKPEQIKHKPSAEISIATEVQPTEKKPPPQVKPGEALATGEEYEKAVAGLMEMGFAKSEVEKAMKAAFCNPERATDYLLNVLDSLFFREYLRQYKKCQYQEVDYHLELDLELLFFLLFLLCPVLIHLWVEKPSHNYVNEYYRIQMNYRQYFKKSKPQTQNFTRQFNRTRKSYNNLLWIQADRRPLDQRQQDHNLLQKKELLLIEYLV